MPVVTMPNGLVVEMPNRAEAAFLYDEIFESGVYRGHGLEIADGDCVFDVGANVGLFSASLVQRHRDLRLVLFEPLPETFALLERNAARLLRGAQVTLLQVGVSSAPGRATFELDERWTLAAGGGPSRQALEVSFRSARRHAGRLAWNRAVLADAKRAGVIRTSTARRVDAALDNRLLRPLAFAAMWAFFTLVGLKTRQHRQRVDCELTTVSAAMREHGIERLDLLKIDVEGAEWDVLQGIDESDWPCIRQLALEIHAEGDVDRVQAFLEDKGFVVVVDRPQDGWRLPELLGFRMVYARR